MMKCVVMLAIILAYMRNLECSSVVGFSRTLSDLDKVMEGEVARELQEDLEDLLGVLMEKWSHPDEPEGEHGLLHHQYSLHASTHPSGSPSSLAQSARRGQEALAKQKEKEVIVSQTREVETSNVVTGSSGNWPAVYNEAPTVIGKGAKGSAGVQAEAGTLGKPRVKLAARVEAIALPLPLAVAADGPHGATETGGGRGRGARQAPPNVLYRRRKEPRPCRGDGTSALFTGSSAMTYISFLANVLSLVLNINNNVNNNNNNNNINSNNNIDSNNANLNINSNNANQVNIMPPGGKRRRRSIPSWAQMDASSRAFCSTSYGMVEGVVEAAEAGWRALAASGGDPGAHLGTSGTLIASS